MSSNEPLKYSVCLQTEHAETMLTDGLLLLLDHGALALQLWLLCHTPLVCLSSRAHRVVESLTCAASEPHTFFSLCRVCYLVDVFQRKQFLVCVAPVRAQKLSPTKQHSAWYSRALQEILACWTLLKASDPRERRPQTAAIEDCVHRISS